MWARMLCLARVTGSAPSTGLSLSRLAGACATEPGPGTDPGMSGGDGQQLAGRRGALGEQRRARRQLPRGLYPLGAMAQTTDKPKRHEV
jgi:hypothetical protein